MTEDARPAIAHGGPLDEPGVMSLGEALRRAARSDGAIVHIGLDGTAVTRSYAELMTTAARLLSGIRAAGVPAGAEIVLQFDDDQDLLAAFWACVLGGYVPVPVSARPPRTGAFTAPQLLRGVWGMLGTAYVLADDTGDGFGERRLPPVADLLRHPPASDLHHPDPDDPAALLLTSGSTGLPKAVVLTHRNILSRSAATAAVRGLSSSTRSFNWMPLDHVGGLVMFHIRDVYLRCHQVHARIEWVLEDPLRWLAAISEHRCDTTWAPNFAFGLVVDRAAELEGRGWDLHRLRYIMNGGEPIRVRTANRFLALLRPYGLPPTAMHPGWGMSETSAGVVDCVFPPGLDEATRYIPVGTPHPGVSLRVVDAADTVVAEGVVGRLQVTGLPITPGYHANPAQNARSFTPDGWFRTGDLASIAGGVLTVTGRVDDVIVLDGVRCHAHEIEAAVEQLPFVTPTYTIACTVPAGDTEELMVYYHPRSGRGTDEHAARIVAHLEAALGVSAARVVPIAKDEVPKTGIGKLRRAALASSA